MVLLDPASAHRREKGKDLQAGEDSQSRSLWSEPKDNNKISIFSSEETGAVSSLAPDTFLPAEFRC